VQLETNRAALEHGGEVGTLRMLGEGRVPGNRLSRNRWVGRVKQAGKGGRVRKARGSASPASA
jgi:hypothetical protein